MKQGLVSNNFVEQTAHSLFDNQVDESTSFARQVGAAFVGQNGFSGHRTALQAGFESTFRAPFSRLSGRMRFHLRRLGDEASFWVARPSASNLAAPFWLATSFPCLTDT